jgi:hypothetical protein
MLIGAVLLVVGTALYDPRAAVLVAGACVLAAGVDLARGDQ